LLSPEVSEAINIHRDLSYIQEIEELNTIEELHGQWR
jgi:hypothetical protein